MDRLPSICWAPFLGLAALCSCQRNDPPSPRRSYEAAIEAVKATARSEELRLTVAQVKAMAGEPDAEIDVAKLPELLAAQSEGNAACAEGVMSRMYTGFVWATNTFTTWSKPIY